MTYLQTLAKSLSTGAAEKAAETAVKNGHTQCLKITQDVAFEFLNFGISTNFCPFKTDMYGNTV